VIVYLAGPYRAKTAFEVVMNILKIRKDAMKLWNAGYVVICPHLNTFLMDGLCNRFSQTFSVWKKLCLVYQFLFRFNQYDEKSSHIFLGGDMEILHVCDAICMTNGWKKRWTQSIGAVKELQYARKQKRIQIFLSPESAIRYKKKGVK